MATTFSKNKIIPGSIPLRLWKMLQDIIYDRLPIRNIGDLTEEIEKAIFIINAIKRATIKNL